MVRKSECAWNCNGKCRLCNGDCKVRHDEGVCADAVRRAVHHSVRGGLPVRMRPMESARDRFRHATEGVRGWEVYRSCKSKQRYQTEDIANKKGKQMSRRYGYEQRPYYCKFCGGYHLTTKGCRCHEEVVAAA